MRLLPRGLCAHSGARSRCLVARRQWNTRVVRQWAGRVVRRMSLLDEGLHPQQVSIHFALRVGAEEPCQSMADRPADRVIAHLDMDSRAALMNRLEMYDSAVPDRRAWQALPRHQLVLGQPSDLSRPFNRQPRRPGDNPMRSSLANGLRLAHPGHKPRKVPMVGPEIEDLLDR